MTVRAAIHEVKAVISHTMAVAYPVVPGGLFRVSQARASAAAAAAEKVKALKPGLNVSLR